MKKGESKGAQDPLRETLSRVKDDLSWPNEQIFTLYPPSFYPPLE